MAVFEKIEYLITISLDKREFDSLKTFKKNSFIDKKVYEKYIEYINAPKCEN
jgi:hypothetical protein